MEILTSIVSKIAEYTVAPIGRHVGYLFSYNHNFKELNDQVENLKIAREDIESLVELEKREGKEILVAVKNWLERVDGVTDEARQLCEDPRREMVGCSKYPFVNLWRRHQLSRKATKVAKNVANVQGDGKFERDKIGYLPPIDGVGSPSAVSHFVNFESRMSKMNEIMLALADPKLSILGVYGFGGVGKSTLVKQIARKAKLDNLFKEVAMASVTRIPDLRRIQGEIADQLGLQFTEETVPGRANRLRKRITQAKNILIILDDIWATIELEDIGIPYGGKVNFEERKLPSLDDKKGCKVLLISRNQGVLQQMGTQKDFGLEVLSEEETWTLFEFMAGKNTEDRTYERIAREVARKCAGLPVLIVPVARALKNKDKRVWKDTLKQLARVNNEELHDIINSSLEWSYNQLENDEVKAVFLLCGVEGPCASVQDLLKYAMGLGIFKHIDTVEDASNRLYNIISALKASSLLHGDEFDVKLVKMHDIIHDVAISIASRNDYAFVRKHSELTEWPTDQVFLRSCSKIVLYHCNIQKIPEGLDCPELESFHLSMVNNFSLEIPDSFFEGMKKIKVVDLTGMNISSFPASLCSLTKLETLCLDHCTLGDIAGIGALKSLKILSLCLSSMAELPSEIRQLSNMRMLDMSYSKIAVIPPNVISSLIALEELYMGGASTKWEDCNSTNQGKNASLAELRQLPNLSALEVQVGEARNLARDLWWDKLERFKILIGGAWKWTDDYVTSNTLKLKLSTPIHLEYGIRALIKKVESLWLDEINGISNVLYQLNGEGFPLLKHLHIQNNTQIQHIIDSVGWNQAYDSFPILETLELQNLSKLEKLSHGLLSVNSLSKLKVIKVRSCQQLKYFFSDSMVKGLFQLNEIEVSECNSLQQIVFVEHRSVGDNGITDTIEFRGLRSLTLQKLPKLDGFFSNEFTKANDKRLATTPISDPFFKEKVAFPYLEALTLSSINFHRIWHDEQLSATCGLQNLTSLIVVDCRNLKHLFSCSMIPNLSKLKQLEISKCHMMEEIIDSEGGRNNGFPSNEVQFSSLEKITITHMENLRTVWRCQFGGLKSLVVKNCAKLVCIFPSSMQKEFQSLETLVVTDCCSVEEIFKLDANEIGGEEDATNLTSLTLDHLPKLKQIWSMDPNRILNFPNLQAINIEYCDSLEYLFPLSIATRLQKIEELHVTLCGNIKEIVANKGRMQPIVRFVLNQLTSLHLVCLHELRGFYAENYTLSCPSLKKMHVFHCENLMLFTTQPINNREGHRYAQLQQPLFTVQEVIPNLEKLALNNKYASMILQDEFPAFLFHKLKTLMLSEFRDDHDKFPDWFLRNVPSLERLTVERSSFKEIFQENIYSGEGEEERIQSSKRVKILTLFELPKLQHICKEGFQIDPVLEVIEALHVVSCSSLTNLVPSSVTFSCLTSLEVENCNGLIKLITSTTARSLVKLRTMKIKGCNLLKEIVSGEEGEAKDEIAFMSLGILELVCLPRLNKFCSSTCFIKFPLLWKVVVRQCSRMEIFSRGNMSTPNLSEVQVNDEEEYWDGNLNGTIRKMFTDMVRFCSFTHLNLSEFPELKDWWYHPQHKVFHNLKSLVVHKCDFLSDVLFTSNLFQVLLNLEELDVKDCNSIEQVFDMKGMNDMEMMGKQTTQLKKLTLSGLPKLKQIWSKDVQEIISFKSLCVVQVKNCKMLKNLFLVSICQDLEELKELDIESCGIEEIAVEEEESKECRFDFPQLTRVRFWRLSKLRSFYLGKHTLNCPSLKVLSVYQCEALQTFGFSHSDFEHQHQVNGVDILIQQSLFSAEKVAFPNLEALKLSSINFHRIWDDDQHFAICAFQNLTRLVVEDCGNLKYLFSCSMIPSLAKLKQLEISKCHMMEEIIDPEEGRNNAVALKEVQFRSLEIIMINDMENLRTAWHCQFDGLRSMVIQKCAKLVCIFPSHMQRKFHNLETLTAGNCDLVKEIFELDPSEIGCEGHATKLVNLTLHHLPKLKQIWGVDPERILSFPNLQAVHVHFCHNLEYLFPLSIATRIQKIEKLEVKWCENMKEIVAKKEGRTEPTVQFLLNQLTTLWLQDLNQLRGFYAGNYTLSCPSLKILDVRRCEKLMLFTTQPRNNQEGHDDAKLQQPLFTVQEVTPNLEKLTLNSKYASMILREEFPSLLLSKLKFLEVHEFEDEHGNFVDWCLQNVPSLGSLIVANSPFKEIFQDNILVSEEGQLIYSTRIKQLGLITLPKLQRIWKEGSQIHPALEVLEHLVVMNCPSLINLVPSSVTFSCLTFLGVENCNGLIKLITSATATSLVKLQKMKIEDCNLLEEIVTEKEGEPKDEIVFASLEILELTCLPRLNKFCSSTCFIKFPLLWKVVVRQCPRMEIFSGGNVSTPVLDEVQVNDEEWCWESDLNGTIQKMFTDMVAFRSIEHMNLSQFPELKILWYGPPMHNFFQNLKSLVVHKCDFLSDVLFTSNLLPVLQNLEDLELKDCDSIETVFDVKCMDDKQVLVKQATQMKKLTLSGLPKLKHIWSKDSQEIIGFRNLCSVQVAHCESLEYLFPFSQCRDLELLEELNIESCGVVEIVSKKEGFEECRFHFPQLTRMRLWNLSKLNSFYPGNHTLECPLLKDLNVCHCEALQIFDFDGSDAQQLHQVNKLDIPVQQALFCFERVCTGLEKLALDSKDVMTLQNGQHPENLFRKINFLRLQSFHETATIVPVNFLQRFPNLVTLVLRCSSFHTFHSATSVHVEELMLFKLENLEFIWNEDNQSDTLVQHKSPEIDMMPSSFPFKKLIKLHVEDCKALIYLITSSIAKSLVQLRRMTIKECEMEYAVKINEEVAEEEITFENLEYLELNSLSRFRSFCSGKCKLIFPSLMALKTMGCPKTEIFSPGIVIAPMLRVVEVENERKRFNGDLNAIIRQVFGDKSLSPTWRN